MVRAHSAGPAPTPPLLLVSALPVRAKGKRPLVPAEPAGAAIRFQGTYLGTACVPGVPLPYPCWWDVRVSHQDLGPPVSPIVTLSGSVEACVPDHIDAALQASDQVEVHGELISMTDSAWVCEGAYYMRRSALEVVLVPLAMMRR